MRELDLKLLIAQAEKIALSAGDFALKMQGKAKRSVEKEMKGDFATDVDIENEKMIVQALEKLDPKFPIFTEEEYKRPDADIYWVVDPLDGTKNYYPGLPLWGVNIALYDEKNKEVLLGVVYLPAFKHVFKEYKNGGATLNGKSISPSDISDPAEAKICIEPPYATSGFLAEEDYQKIRQKIYRIRSWGLASELCYVATGAFEAYFDFSGSTRDYDIFAPMIIAKEAGCKIESFDIGADYRKRVIKVTNGKLTV